MEDTNETSQTGEPKDPIDQYDAEHGKPQCPDYRVNPTNPPERGPRSFNVKG